MKDIRLFIALNISPFLLKRIRHTLEELKAYLPHKGLRWVPIDNMHLTLKFLGDVPASKIHEIQLALRKTAEQSKPCNIEISKLGAYPDILKPRVIWIGVSSDHHLINLYANLEKNLTSIGYEPERRGFSPHITLARISKKAATIEIAQISPALSKLDIAPLGTCSINAIHLYKSELNRTGAIYSELFSTPINANI